MFVDIHFKDSCEYNPPTTFEIDSCYSVKSNAELIAITDIINNEVTTAIYNRDIIYSMFIRNK